MLNQYIDMFISFFICLDNPEINELQVKDFQQVFARLDPSISLICVCGNHDIGNSPDENSIAK